MSSNRLVRIEKSLTVASFLGGLTLAVLTFLFPLNMPTERVSFVFQSVNSGDYKDLLIIVTGIASTFLILSVWGMKRVIVLNRPGGTFSTISLGLYESGFGSVLLLLPLLVIPFFEWGGYIIFAIESGWIVILGVDYIIAYKKEKRRKLDYWL